MRERLRTTAQWTTEKSDAQGVKFLGDSQVMAAE